MVFTRVYVQLIQVQLIQTKKRAYQPLHTVNICQNYNPPGALLDRSGAYAFVKKVPGCSKFIRSTNLHSTNLVLSLKMSLIEWYKDFSRLIAIPEVKKFFTKVSD